MKATTNLRLNVEVDVDAWNREYGTEDSPREVLDQVKDQLTDAARISVSHLGDTVVIRGM